MDCLSPPSGSGPMLTRALQPGIQATLIGPILSIGSMCSMQMASVFAQPVMTDLGVFSTSFIRMATGALLLLAFAWPRHMTLKQVPVAVVMGAILAANSVCFFTATRYLPLGLVTAISFLGPLGMAIILSRRIWDLSIVVLAAVGVFLLLKPDFGGWQSNALGLALAGASACFWASYILCIRRLGSVFKGNEGLAVALTVAAILILPLALLYPPPTPNAGSIGLAMMIALLAPILPCVLEMQALRMMSTRSFSILMSFEPGVGAIAGFAFLAQSPSLPQAVGLALVVFASIGSVLTSQ
jgi:inner membrane transporter RhtA